MKSTKVEKVTYFLELSFAPFSHFVASVASCRASSTAAFWAAASALRALPAAFLLFSPPPFFPAMGVYRDLLCSRKVSGTGGANATGFVLRCRMPTLVVLLPSSSFTRRIREDESGAFRCLS